MPERRAWDPDRLPPEPPGAASQRSGVAPSRAPSSLPSAGCAGAQLRAQTTAVASTSARWPSTTAAGPKPLLRRPRRGLTARRPQSWTSGS
eukprot:15477737-Alexandrium_andersonii.AAC.1